MRILLWNITRATEAVSEPHCSGTESMLHGLLFVSRKSVLRAALLGAGALFIAACATPVPNVATGLQIRGLVIENQTQMWVSAARLLVPATGRFVSCGNISPEASCSTTFPETDYTGNPVQITWSQAGQIHSIGEFVLEAPEDIDINRPAMVRVVISAPGSAGAAIVQDTN